MMVRCISNLGKTLPPAYIDSRYGYPRDAKLPLIVEKRYVVYAIGIGVLFNGPVWYYICDEHFSYYPTPNPAPLFEIVNSKPSKYWKFKYVPERTGGYALLANDHWVMEEHFYDKLTDNCDPEVAAFKSMKEAMDAEAAEATQLT